MPESWGKIARCTFCTSPVHLEGFQQSPVSPVLQLVLVPCLSEAQHGLALPVQLVVEVVQQRGSCAPLKFRSKVVSGKCTFGRSWKRSRGVWAWRVSPRVWQICPICSRRFQRWSALSAGTPETLDPENNGTEKEESQTTSKKTGRGGRHEEEWPLPEQHWLLRMRQRFPDLLVDLNTWFIST